ncbi:MAG TPA: hypothetical protein VMD59_14340 [Acidimicrobiales bacterium]|nr:hypothetical protein [Acidimicrobiales bacterium]
MVERVPSPWRRMPPHGHEPRVVVEIDDPALALSEFRAFRQANLDVAFCRGPRPAQRSCPLLRSGACPLLEDADVVLHGLDGALSVSKAIARRYPQLPVVLIEPVAPVRSGHAAGAGPGEAEGAGKGAGEGEGAERGRKPSGLERSSSIDAQIRAVLAALAGRPPAAPDQRPAGTLRTS